MANWCGNWVNLSGEPEKVKAFMEDIKALKQKGIKNECGVSALEKPENGGYMFDFNVDEESFSFESKWSPVFDSLHCLATKHGVTVTNQYEECGMGIYGQWTSDGESESDVCLTEEEYDLAGWDEDSDLYTFEGEDYECREDILCIILERKMAQ